jgi:hypothetical protein
MWSMINPGSSRVDGYLEVGSDDYPCVAIFPDGHIEFDNPVYELDIDSLRELLVIATRFMK